jgi:ribulose-phosphate 3-epimerase
MIQNKNKGFTLIELLVVIPKIRALKEQHLNVKISVDGGINSQNAKQILEAGADVLVVGSAIFGGGNIGDVIKKLKILIYNG